VKSDVELMNDIVDKMMKHGKLFMYFVILKRSCIYSFMNLKLQLAKNIQDKIISCVLKFTRELPSLPSAWSTILNSWAKRVRVLEHETILCIFKLQLTEKISINLGASSLLQQENIWWSNLCSEIRQGESNPPNNIIISMMLKIAHELGYKDDVNVEHCDNYVYIHPQHAINTFTTPLNAYFDYKNLICDQWIPFRHCTGRPVLNGKIPLKEYAYELIRVLYHAQVEEMLLIFFHNQLELHKKALCFLDKFSEIWYNTNYDLGVFQTRDRSVTLELYHDDGLNSQTLSWNAVGDKICAGGYFWSKEQVHLLFQWMYICFMQNHVFLMRNWQYNPAFPKKSDDFSNPRYVKGALGTLLVPRNILYYQSVFDLINSKKITDRECCHIIQDYFNDFLYTLPLIRDAYQETHAIRVQYEMDKS
jgi:hypothetical protein